MVAVSPDSPSFMQRLHSDEYFPEPLPAHVTRAVAHAGSMADPVRDALRISRGTHLLRSSAKRDEFMAHEEHRRQVTRRIPVGLVGQPQGIGRLVWLSLRRTAVS
jgi:hypothetical protein